MSADFTGHRSEPVALLALEPVLDLFENRVERQPGVADRRKIDRNVLVDGIGVERRMGDLLAFGHSGGEARPGKAAADAEDEVGVLQEVPEMLADADAT